MKGMEIWKQQMKFLVRQTAAKEADSLCHSLKSIRMNFGACIISVYQSLIFRDHFYSFSYLVLHISFIPHPSSYQLSWWFVVGYLWQA